MIVFRVSQEDIIIMKDAQKKKRISHQQLLYPNQLQSTIIEIGYQIGKILLAMTSNSYLQNLNYNLKMLWRQVTEVKS